MNPLSVLEELLENRHRQHTCDDEFAYYDLWQRERLYQRSPLEQAIIGGYVADRLPWVFTAGYQATLSNAFYESTPKGWSAFAATEDQADKDTYPGTTLSEAGAELRLDGCKLWVAHSRFVDRLIVTVNDPDGDKRKARGVIVPRDAPGVTLTHRESPGFLREMSQGFARFDRTPIATDDVFEFEPIRQFGRTEAKFVMLASAAFMLGLSSEQVALRDRLYTLCSAFIALLLEEDTSRQVYGALERDYQQCVAAFESSFDTDQITNYAADRRLFAMYSERIQRRVGYARAESSA